MWGKRPVIEMCRTILQHIFISPLLERKFGILWWCNIKWSIVIVKYYYFQLCCIICWFYILFMINCKSFITFNDVLKGYWLYSVYIQLSSAKNVYFRKKCVRHNLLRFWKNWLRDRKIDWDIHMYTGRNSEKERGRERQRQTDRQRELEK